MYFPVYQVRVFSVDKCTDTILFENLDEAKEFAKNIASKYDDIYTTYCKHHTTPDGLISFAWYGDDHSVCVDEDGWATQLGCTGDKIRLMPQCLVFDNVRSLRQHIKNTQTYYNEHN